MYKLFLFLLFVGAVVCSPSTPVKKCKGFNEQLFERVVVTTQKGVCTKLPCELISGTDVKTDLSFLVKHKVEKITVKCNATSLGVTIEHPIPNADKGCDMLTNTYCPIDPDTEADLSFKMHVSKLYPKIPVDLVMYLVDQNKKVISCFEVNTRVVNNNLIYNDFDN